MSPSDIYLDHHATTPPDPEVVEAMIPYLSERFGNPSSHTHEHGRQARDAVEVARREVAQLIAADPSEIVFTSGATESNNLAVKGSGWALRDRRKGLITSRVEHKSVLESCRWMAGEGFSVSEVGVDEGGRVDPGEIHGAIGEDTALVSIMHANSEVGTIQPVEAIGRHCRERSVRFHVDAAQSVGRIPVDVTTIGCDLLSLSGHKLYGPKGIGALFVRRRTRLVPLMSGGGQEKGRRSGTLDVAGIVGLGTACRLAATRLAADAGRILALRERLRRALFEGVPGVLLNGPLEGRLPGNLNVSFEDLDGQALIQGLEGISVSSGSACAAGSTDPSYVLIAMGRSPEQAFGSVRFGVGRGNTESEIDSAVSAIARAAERLRALSTRVPEGDR